MKKYRKKYDVYSIGNYCVDIIIKPIDHFPQIGGSIDFDEFMITTGGCSNNTAIALTRLGQTVAVGGLVGEDKFGDQIIDSLISNGVDIKGIVQKPNLPTSISIVLVNSKGERSFICNQGSTIALSSEHIDWDLLAQSRILHIAGFGTYPKLEGDSLVKILRKARGCGLLTSIDTTSAINRNTWKSLVSSFQYINYFFPNLVEAKVLTGKETPKEIAEILLKKGIEVVVVKMGENGNYLATQEGQWSIPTFKIEAVDTCGAGDTFAAGFLSGVLKGWKLLKTAQFANAVGATCVKAVGATTGILSFEKTLEFIKKNNLINKPTKIK